MKQSQYERLAKLLIRKAGVTAMDITQAVGTVCPHKRLSEMKERGWRITRRPVPGKTYGTYHGTSPRPNRGGPSC